ncbi:hypothetical protein BT93_B1001 [Corymbia citriodora subsp. variegata]|nr:hypothetical protein BT93_B1001 [Corymbia citriodora subsp. variegata]
MATLKNFSTFIILLVVTVALLPRATFATIGIPNCSKGITSDCGFGFFKIIVLGDTSTPADVCCRELVKAGKNCHNQFVELIISSKKPIRGTISDVYRRGNETWNNCAASSVVSPPEPAH